MVERGEHLRLGLIAGELRLGLILRRDIKLRLGVIRVKEVLLRTDGDMARQDHELAGILPHLQLVGEPSVTRRVHPAGAVKHRAAGGAD